MTRNEHPAWSLYNIFRTAKLNEKYYSHRINTLQVQNTVIEIIIAFTAPTGTISALWFWDDPTGKIVWKILLVIAAVAALIKPFMNLVERIKKMETILSGYRLLVHDCSELINNMIEQRSYSEEIKQGYKDASKRKGVLISQCPESKPKKRLIAKYTSEVLTELKDFNFYIPEESNV